MNKEIMKKIDDYCSHSLKGKEIEICTFSTGTTWDESSKCTLEQIKKSFITKEKALVYYMNTPIIESTKTKEKLIWPKYRQIPVQFIPIKINTTPEAYNELEDKICKELIEIEEDHEGMIKNYDGSWSWF